MNGPGIKTLLDLLGNFHTNQSVNSEALGTSLTLIFQDFISKIYFQANWSQI